MHRTTRIKITELNPHVICVLCGGYYINATTITECLHSFCRTCITRYLETSKYCPICDVMVHKTRPLDYIRSDKTLQDLVYKLVPGLYKNEMKRRRDYYAQHPGAETLPPSEDRGVEFHDRIIYTEDEKISLSLELCAEGIPFKTPSQIHGHNGPDNIKISDARYLVCPAAFSVGNLKKFIRMKFDLKPKYEIDIFQTAEPLADFYTLMDIAYIYTWTRRAPLRLYYTVYERLSAPKVPTAVCEKQASIVSKGITSGSASKQDSTEETHGVKRKQDDGPDDVSFDQSAVTPEKTEETIKTETCNPKKKNKKQVDSTVLEAVSKSEEILAKLTLDCSNDANGLMRNEDQRPEALAVNDVANKEQNKDSSKSEDLSTCTPIKTSALNQDDSPVLSLFEPLNAEPSGTNVYDFNTQEPSSSSSGETDKPKGKRGRKKKRVTERDKNEDDSSVSNKVSENETNLVISNKHPGIKAATPKKERKKLATVSDHIEAKDGKVKAKKTKKDSGHAKGKAKTVKEILEKAQNKTNEEKVPKKRGRPQGSVNKVKKVKVDGNSKIQQNEPESDVKSQENAKQGGVDDVQSAVSLKPVSVKSETGVNNKIDPAVVTADKTTTDSSLNETVPKIYNNIEHPVTPPYGQTPKPAELNPGLPVSVTNGSVNMGQNGALNNGIFVPSMNGIGVINGHDFRPIINGYIPPVDNSDQPLDLTNNAQRSEYMKGKIFKTKMLKKTPTKSDGFTGSGDRANAVND